MPSDVVKKDGDYVFTGFLHLSPEKGVRHSKTSSGSYPNERMCKVRIRVPVTAFKTPEFEVNIGLNGPDIRAEAKEVEALIAQVLDPFAVQVNIAEINAEIEE